MALIKDLPPTWVQDHENWPLLLAVAQFFVHIIFLQIDIGELDASYLLSRLYAIHDIGYPYQFRDILHQ